MTGSLAETIAGFAMQAATLLTFQAAIAANLAMEGRVQDAAASALDLRQTEHLLDSTFRAACASPSWNVSVISGEELQVLADLDADGFIDGRSAETTAFRLRSRTGGHALLHAMGRQSMTVMERIPGERRIQSMTPTGGLTQGSEQPGLTILPTHQEFPAAGQTAPGLNTPAPATGGTGNTGGTAGVLLASVPSPG